MISVLIPANSAKPIREVSPAKGAKFSLAELQSFVGGYIEHIGSNYLQIWLNEEGKLEGRAFNSRATKVAHLRKLISPDDSIVGDVLLQASAQHGRNNLAVLLNTPLPAPIPDDEDEKRGLPSNGEERC